MLLFFHTATAGVVAFYAYMSHTEYSPSNHHTIIFDIPVTNLGNGYNHFSGIFSVPTSGVYVFSWTIADSMAGYVFSELVVNADVVGGILTQTLSDNDRISTTGLVVKEVRQGDVVYVRTSATGGMSRERHLVDGNFHNKYGLLRMYFLYFINVFIIYFCLYSSNLFSINLKFTALTL